eukprot:TRINITY_DN5159_c0_g1_i1.p1 TRINITY_DN5159_c0_g1~~TRINITY_DN5159_c0_g1_i1.p1  ORF type:complete len:415 (-),score=63.37 TRINITY_DN5159_c0_g1_i1:175-1419(-)
MASAILEVETHDRKSSPDSDYHEEVLPSPKTSSMLSKKKLESELLFSQAKIASMPPSDKPLRTIGMPGDRRRRESLSSQSGREAPPCCRPSSRGRAGEVTKEQQARDLFSLYNASSGSLSTDLDNLSLVSVNLLKSARHALRGLRGCTWSVDQMSKLIKTLDSSEHHPGYVSQTAWVECLLAQLPEDELEFQRVIGNLTDALQWIQFQTATEVVVGVHADKCGSACDHLPEGISQLLPSKSFTEEPASPPQRSPGSSSLAVKGRTNRLRHLFRCCVQQEGVLRAGFLQSLGQVCQTLGHRTLQHCPEHATCDEFVWSDDHFQDAITALDSQCNGAITEAAFVQLFQERLPVNADTFEAVVLQLEAGAKHLRNVEYATELNRHRHSSHSREDMLEAEPKDNRGCKRGCVSDCTMM